MLRQQAQLCGRALGRHSHNLARPSSAPRRSRCGMTTTAVLAPEAAVRAAVAPAVAPTTEVDAKGLERIAYRPEGWNFWDWRGHRVHWVASGPEDGEPVVLVHGYGASAYHWRYQVPHLAAAGYRVYAVCLLGFGWSEKALVDYTNGNQWIAQLSEFVEQVVGGKPVVLAGNSLGGYASLATAAYRPDLVRAVAMLNGAGPFQEAGKPVLDPEAAPTLSQRLVRSVQGLGKRVALFFAFQQARQPGRIKEVLDMVYVNKDQVDADLVDSIVQPATDPRASEVFFRLNHGQKPPLTVNALISRIQGATDNGMPLLLLWGMNDPWITPSRANKIVALYPAAELVPLAGSGHCPHDDTPGAANTALTQWLSKLPEAVPASLAQVAGRLRAV